MTNPTPTRANAFFWRCLMRSAGMTAADRHNYAIFTRWAIAWLVSLLLATLGVKHAWVPAGALRWLTAATPDVFLAGMIYSYFNFLRHADELVRRIQLEGMALGFVCGFAATIGYLVLEKAGAPVLSGATVFQVMLFGWAIGVSAASWRYR